MVGKGSPIQTYSYMHCLGFNTSYAKRMSCPKHTHSVSNAHYMAWSQACVKTWHFGRVDASNKCGRKAEDRSARCLANTTARVLFDQGGGMPSAVAFPEHHRLPQSSHHLGKSLGALHQMRCSILPQECSKRELWLGGREPHTWAAGRRRRASQVPGGTTSSASRRGWGNRVAPGFPLFEVLTHSWMGPFMCLSKEGTKGMPIAGTFL